MTSDESQWNPAYPDGSLLPGEVHVWRVLQEEAFSEAGALNEILTVDEIERAGRFHFEKDRNRFLLTRGTLKKLLSCYLGKDPIELRFCNTEKGKPFLENSDQICFNVSHSGNMILFAISLGKSVGIDVEYMRNNVAPLVVASHFFSEGEKEAMNNCTEQERRRIFFQFWTRKEAIIKALGTGFSFPVEEIDVSTVPGNTFSQVHLPEGNAAACWYVTDLHPGKDYKAALATEGISRKIICRQYAVLQAGN